MRHDIIFRDAGSYASHPHMAVDTDGRWHLVFNVAPRRDIVLHPPLDPDFRNVYLHSDDEGGSWSSPCAIPDDNATGMECAGLTPLGDGAVLVNQWQFGWQEPAADEESADETYAGPSELLDIWRSSPEFAGLHPDTAQRAAASLFRSARRGGQCRVFSTTDSAFEPTRIDTGSFAGGYGMRGGVVLADGTILLPLSDAPHYRTVFMVRSTDAGRSWSVPETVAEAPGREFEEPCLIQLPGGELLMVLRENRTRLLHETRSTDDGGSWTEPRPIGIGDYPADLAILADGRLAMVTGRRDEPFGITLYLSGDGGRSWGAPLFVRDDLPDRDLGYPTLAQRRNGDLVVIYYGREGGISSVMQTLVPAQDLANGEAIR